VGSAESLSADDLVYRNIERARFEAVVWAGQRSNYDVMLQEILTKTPGNVAGLEARSADVQEHAQSARADGRERR
jgi:hypothetical protein